MLYAGSTRSITDEEFTNHYHPLVRLFLTENWPIVETMLDGPFLSAAIRGDITAAEREGWRWRDRHRDLARPRTD